MAKAETVYTLEANEVLRIERLSMHFGGLKAVDDLSFSALENEIFGLIGPNGAGKTTVYNCITQFYKPTNGAVIFRTNKGTIVNLVGHKVHEIIRMGLVRTFQNVELISELSVIDNVLVGANIDFKASGFEQALQLPRARREEREHRLLAMEALESMGIAGVAGQLTGGQPYGVRKKIELARALMCRPKLMILDEPAAGLNDSETELLAETISSIRSRFSCTILLVEHDMGLVMNVCDRVLAISFGNLLACGSPAEIQSNKLVQEAYLGEETD